MGESPDSRPRGCGVDKLGEETEKLYQSLEKLKVKVECTYHPCYHCKTEILCRNPKECKIEVATLCVACYWVWYDQTVKSRDMKKMGEVIHVTSYGLWPFGVYTLKESKDLITLVPESLIFGPGEARNWSSDLLNISGVSVYFPAPPRKSNYRRLKWKDLEWPSQNSEFPLLWEHAFGRPYRNSEGTQLQDTILGRKTSLNGEEGEASTEPKEKDDGGGGGGSL